MQRTLIATLMALAFGLFSMPALQAHPTNGAAIGNSADGIATVEKAQWRRWRGRRACGHRWRSRRVCW